MTEKTPARGDAQKVADPSAETLVAPKDHAVALADTQLATPRVQVAEPAARASGAIDREAPTLDAPVTREAASSGKGLALSLSDADRYEVAGEIARGGLGRILRATDRKLRRPVALKELLSPGTGPSARFLREAHITARLQHPSIIPLYDAGHSRGGDLFYSMKLVFGSSLEEAIFAKKALTERLSLLPHVIDVAEAIAYAHSKRIIHRDLKPQNVLVGEFGETVVIDWGIAKDLAQGGADSDSAGAATPWQAGGGGDLTMDGTIMGTPAYMPPEQARGESVDERADVYALGAILYHLLAGVPPYDDPELRDVLRKLLSSPPVPPIPIDQRLRGVPRDLCAIVNKAMASAPADRYPSAKELAADLKKFQTGQIVGAYSYTAGELALRWLRRNKLVALLLAIMVTGGAASFASIVERGRAAEEGRKEAVIARQKAEDAEARERRRADELRIEQARLSLEHDPQRSLDFLAELSPSFTGMSAARVIAADALSRALPVTLRGHTGGVFSIAFSPDGKLVASASYDRTIRLWDTTTGTARVLEGHTAETHHAVFSPDGKRLASIGYDRTIHLWDVATGTSRALEGHTDWLSAVVFSPDGSTLVSASADQTLRVWDLSREPITSRALVGHTDRVLSLAISPDGKRAVSHGGEGAARLWDLATGRGRIIAADLDPNGGAILFSPNGELVALRTNLSTVRLYDIAKRSSHVLPEHSDVVTELAFSPDGAELAAASVDRTIRIWDVAARTLKTTLHGHEGVISHITYSNDGKQIASCSDDQTLWLWERTTGQRHVYRGHAARVTSVAFSPDGKRLASSSMDGTVRLWTPGDSSRIDDAGVSTQDAVSLGGDRVAVSTWGPDLRLCDVAARTCEALHAHRGAARRLALSPDKKTLASASEDGTVGLWDVSAKPARFVRFLEGHKGAVRDVAFFPDGKRVASGGLDGTLRFWDLATGDAKVIDTHQESVSRIAFARDGGRLLTVGRDKTLRLWDLATFESRVFAGHESSILDASISPDGAQIVTASLDRTARVWSVATGEARIFRADEGGLFAAQFSADGKAVFTASDAGVVRRWDLATGESRAYGAQGASVRALDLSPDGRTLAAAVSDGTIHLWDIATAEGRALVGHADRARGVFFLPDGKRLVSTSDDSTIRLWTDDLPHDEAALRARIKALATPRPPEPGKN